MIDNPEDFLKVCPNGKLLGLDVGTKNIGVAITDESRTICLPSETIARQGNKKDFPILINICKSKNIKGIVIGLPLSFEGEDTESSLFIKRFAENFSKEIELPMVFQDERLSSFIAEDLMLDEIGSNRTKKVVDKIAASYILESFLHCFLK
ncbi:MAG TPA: Holliday junction resolvase RuvX [Rickettsiales bacterium]|nr:Holliday junction resolvase RuvX [Rickettsiales bacterium]